MIKIVTHAQLGSICYHSDKLKPSDNPYSPNQFLALICPYLDLFCCSYSKRTLALLYTNLCLGALTGKLTEVSSLWNAKLLYNFSSKGKLYWACKKCPKLNAEGHSMCAYLFIMESAILIDVFFQLIVLFSREKPNWIQPDIF